MTTDPAGNRPAARQPATSNPQEVDLKILQPDLRGAAAELARQVADIKKSIEVIERAKIVSQRLLKKEVSI